jgi:hypothetical protein
MSTNRAAGALIALLGELLGRPAAPAAGVAWDDLAALAQASRLSPLAYARLAGKPGVPATIRQELKAEAQRSFVATTLLAQALGEIGVALAGLPWLVLRGPVVGASLYGDLMLRPYGDLDILVAPGAVDRAATALRSLGFRQPRGDLPERYYRRFHLHLRLGRPGRAGPLILELHWALDHPFSLYTVDVAGVLRRRRMVQVDALQAPMPAPGDLLVTLALHTVKHIVQLPAWAETGQVERVVETGHLLQLFDLAMAARTYQDSLDWAAAGRLAAGWGAAGAVRACLDAVNCLWPGTASADIRANFSPARLSRWRQALWRGPAGRSGLFGLRRGAFFRPIRVLDAVEYLFPPAEFLRRRYHGEGWQVRAGHGLHAAGSLLAGVAALAYYTAVRPRP